MTKDELMAFLKKHRLSPSQYAEKLGITRMAVEHWLIGRRSIAKPYGRITRLFDKHPELMREFQ